MNIIIFAVVSVLLFYISGLLKSNVEDLLDDKPVYKDDYEQKQYESKIKYRKNISKALIFLSFLSGVFALILLGMHFTV